MSVEFFAECGSNHITKDGPDIDRAFELIEMARIAGCTGVKFQYYKAEKLWHPNMKEELKTAKERELPLEWIPMLSEYARNRGLLFGLSVFDEDSVDEVKDSVDYFKIASFEIGLINLIHKCYLTNKRLMLSIGQSSKEEIESILTHLPLHPIDDIHIDILHCVSKYPTKPEDCNLNIIRINPWINGWSDHTGKEAVLCAAVGSGAEVIEFHLDLDDFEGLETDHSWTPWSITRAIRTIKIIESAMGSDDWDKIINQQDRQHKADPKTGLRGK